MSRRGPWTALLMALALAGPAGAAGQAARITLAPADVVFPEPLDLDFSAGWVDHGGMTVTVEPRTNRRPNWQLFVEASSADMGGYGKSVQDILVRAEGASSWMPLSTGSTLVAEGTGATTVTLYFRLLLDLSADAPGFYSVPIQYSATTF